MNILKSIKTSTLATKGFGLFPIVASSRWRRHHLLILSYHGIAAGEEGLVYPEMFMLPATFTRRMEILASLKFNVLGLSEALRLLDTGKLPSRSVVITFDDGWANFYSTAFPILRKYGFPATVYLTTYYCRFNRPVFRFALSHIAFQSKNAVVHSDGFPWLPERVQLGTPEGRLTLVRTIDEYAKKNAMSAKQKDELATEFASWIGYDYEQLISQRLFHLMNTDEITSLAPAGIDFQLHTHRHRTPIERTRFLQEVEENREIIHDLTGAVSGHFCYPSGAHRPEFLPWLLEAGVQSATTCEYGYASAKTERLLLPRLLDQRGISETEFEAWITGFAALIPHRQIRTPEVAPE